MGIFVAHQLIKYVIVPLDSQLESNAGFLQQVSLDIRGRDLVGRTKVVPDELTLSIYGIGASSRRALLHRTIHLDFPDYIANPLILTPLIVPLVDVIQIMVAAFPEEVMDRSRKIR